MKPMNQPKTAEEQTNAAVIHQLYASAEAVAKDTPKFVSLFAEEGYFYDVAVPILLGQLGVFNNLSAAIQR